MAAKSSTACRKIHNHDGNVILRGSAGTDAEFLRRHLKLCPTGRHSSSAGGSRCPDKLRTRSLPNRSLFASGISAGKGLARRETGAAFLATHAVSEGQRPLPSAGSTGGRALDFQFQGSSCGGCQRGKTQIDVF